MKVQKETKAIRVEVSKDLHKRIRMQALQDGQTLQEFAVAAFNAHLVIKARFAQKAELAKKAQAAKK
jgi:hypothetical protein